MTFSTIIYKNLKFNFTKYLSYYLVNSFIVAIIFMYGSLLFNNLLVSEIGKSFIFQSIKLAFIAIVVFSIIFISYTSICFIKYRGKEFGIYLTLGMTTKDLIKMTLLENVIITMGSLISGIITGLIFSRLFYMIIGKILRLKGNIYYISYKTFLLSSGIFIAIIIFNQLFTSIFILKLSIIEVIKSTFKKEVSKSRPIIGLISLIIFIISSYLLPMTLLRKIFSGNDIIILICIAISIIFPYFIIGSFITLIKEIARKFPEFYNKNLLVLTNLSHRFFAYKVILYIVSLLAAGAIIFIGFSYSTYSIVDKDINERFPYEFMFIQEDMYNNVSSDEVRRLIEDNGGTIDKYNVLESINLPEYREKNGKVSFWSERSVIISESNFNKHMKTNISVKSGEAFRVDVIKQNMKLDLDYNTIFTLDGSDKIKERMKIFNENYEADVDEFNKTVDKDGEFILQKGQIQSINTSFSNVVMTQTYRSGSAKIIDDIDYEKILNKVGEGKILKYHLININKGDKDKIFIELKNYIRKVNANLGDSNLEGYGPISKSEQREIAIESKGFYFFSMLFLGMLFLIASAIVLYYKLVTDIEEEKYRIKSISKVGLTTTEGTKIIVKQLCIIFFVPVIVGGSLGLYYLSVMYSNSALMIFLIKESLIIVGAYALLQVLFYLGIRRKYLNDILK